MPQGSTGSITYAFAKSTKGGTADVYLDGQFKQAVNFAGSTGSMQSPEFKTEYQLSFGNLVAGAHKLEIKNMSGVVYLDRFVLVSSSSSAQPPSGPGATSNQSGSAAGGQASSSSYAMPANSQEVSIVAESSVNVPFKLLLVDPKGLTLQTADASSGMAVLNVPVSQSGDLLDQGGEPEPWTIAVHHYDNTHSQTLAGLITSRMKGVRHAVPL